MRTDDLRIAKTHPLLSPAVLAEEFPLCDRAADCVATQRTSIERILSGEDRRLLVVVGPCSIHDVDAAREYAARLRPLVAEFADRLLVVMRVYFEKPRTILGWKGLINDPDLDNSYRINRGLRLARQLMCDIAELELGAATEFLDTTLGQFYADLVCWAAIGARTVESQIHRELASGLSMPVGFKNRTDGNVQVAVEAIISAQNRHLFPSLTAHGAPAIFETTGNPWGHLVLRGGKQSGPNFAAPQIEAAASQLAAADIKTGIMVDCSHGNSEKNPARQLEVADCIAEQLRAGSRAIRAVMVESHLVAGAQPIAAASSLVYGQSITDACLGFDDTRRLLDSLAAAVGK
ncbi:3-deoxy-7-phosphoheptulonate synthase [Planctomycetaceae bacterium SH139]